MITMKEQKLGGGFWIHLALLLAVPAMLSLGACATSGNPPALVPGMPGAWAESGASDAASPSRDWWLSFGSDELSELIEASLSRNPEHGDRRRTCAPGRSTGADRGLDPVSGLEFWRRHRASRYAPGWGQLVRRQFVERSIERKL